MLPLFDRKRRRLQRIQELLGKLSDDTVRAVLERHGPEGIAVVFALVKVDRATKLGRGLDAPTVRKAMKLARASSGPSMEASARLLLDLRQAAIYDADQITALAKDAPLAVRAIDMAGRALGTWRYGAVKAPADDSGKE
jgi:hypothetical protein